jgi:hypothetical protein
MMSISERERQTLESIENGLVRSAPKLASMLAIFTRLTASEKMPARRPVRRASGPRTGAGIAAGQRVPGQGWRPYLGRTAHRWIGLAIALALLALVVILGHGTGAARCPASPRAVTACGHAPVRPAAHHPGGS